MMEFKYSNGEIVVEKRISSTDILDKFNKFIVSLRELAHDILLQDKDVDEADRLFDSMKESIDIDKMMRFIADKATNYDGCSTIDCHIENAFRSVMSEIFSNEEKRYKELVGEGFDSEELDEKTDGAETDEY